MSAPMKSKGVPAVARAPEIGETIRTIHARTGADIVKRCVGIVKGAAGGIRGVLYIRNEETETRRADPFAWRQWREDAAREAREGNKRRALQAQRGGLVTPPPPVRRAPVVFGPEPIEEISRETRDVLTKPVQRRCRCCPNVFLTRIMSVQDCPACRAKAKAAEDAAARKKTQGAAE